MATFHYPIDQYWIYHTVADNTRQSATVLCYRPPPDNASPAAYLRFYREGETIPESKELNGRLHLNFPGHQFTEVMETIRRERPTFAYYNTQWKSGYVMTHREPGGEEEPT